jgi:tetratricopeptide (TPR) repeat protein
MRGVLTRIATLVFCVWVTVALSQELKQTFWDSSSPFERKVLEECKDKKFAELVSQANSYSATDWSEKDLGDRKRLKKAAQLYEQIVKEYPDYMATIAVQVSLFGDYVRLYLLTDEEGYREKAVSTARKAIERIDDIQSGGIKSEFLVWQQSELLVRLLKLEEEIPEPKLKQAKDFYLMSLSDRITSNLLSHSYGRLAEIYTREKDIAQGMKYINKGLALADKLRDDTKRANFLFLATKAMRVSGDQKKAQEFYRQLMDVEQPTPEMKRIIDKRLSNTFGRKSQKNQTQ